MITEGILPDSIVVEARDVMQTRLRALTNIKRNLQLAQERMKKYADTKRSERESLQWETWHISNFNHIDTTHWAFTEN
jgi:hypothetical protein